MKKQTKNIAKPEGYNEIYNDIKFLLDKAKVQAYKAVDNIRVPVYWQVGERIVRGELQHKERADYGKRLIVNLTKDLGFIKRDLYRMVQFYRTYPIMTSLMSQLSWTHYTVLITMSNKNERKLKKRHREKSGLLQKKRIYEANEKEEKNEPEIIKIANIERKTLKAIVLKN